MERFISHLLLFGILSMYFLSNSMSLAVEENGKEEEKGKEEDEGKEMKELECFECKSNFLANGNDDPCIRGDVEKLNVTKCFGNKACVKVYTRLYNMKGGDSNWENAPTVVSRFCDVFGDYEIGCDATDANHGERSICFCDENKCNGSAHLAASVPLSIILGLIFTKFF